MAEARFSGSVIAGRRKSNIWREYYVLTKPGIVYGNDLAAAAGFLFASRHSVHFGAFIAMLIGLSLVIASACVFNNLLDQRIDSLMRRTKKRPLVQGSISRRSAEIYGSLLGISGLAVLLVFDNLLAAGTALAGMFLYIVIYGWAKRNTVYSTLIGSLSGSAPPIVGYAAVTGHLDATALWLFIIMAAWQMPHFYAIAMFRREDYAAAGLPVWSVKHTVRSTKLQIIYYIALFVIACAIFDVVSRAGWSFLVITTGLGLYWLAKGLGGFKATDDIKWARQMFGLSLVSLLVLCASLSISVWLP